MKLDRLRQQVVSDKHVEEHQFVTQLLNKPKLDKEARQQIIAKARKLVEACRDDTGGQTMLDSFLLEFGLSNKEGVALMCLAEALLRVPDSLTADRLIAEKIDSGDWGDHSGKSDSTFVNFATWGMILTGKLVHLDQEITERPGSWLKDLTSSLSEPLVRRAMLQAMRIMGGQYVLGRTIDEGIKRGHKNHDDGTCFSFDMLGEGARTTADAERYFQSYKNAFERVGKHNNLSDVRLGNGVSVKLSALHPRYEFAQRDLVMAELLPKITELCVLAKHYNISLSIDAEEAARLEMSIDIFQQLCRDPVLENWDGLGFVMQAYQKRAPAVANWLVALAEESNRHLMVRLVKGAYWDAEIKHSQEFGLRDYPVFTRKQNTDLCYLSCAKILLGARGKIFPQFATHNAYSAASVMQLAASECNPDYEFQRLYGMGELLYKHLRKLNPDQEIPLRVYAPIGEHQDLLPYLVRRLLENGANSSFVNRFLDDETPIDELITDIYDEVTQHELFRHTKISTPENLFRASGEHRLNAAGVDLDEPYETQPLIEVIEKTLSQELFAHSIVAGKKRENQNQVVNNPSDTANPAGRWSEADTENINLALDTADHAYTAWRDTSAKERADILLRAADLIEQNTHKLIGIICTEAGRTINDCVSEIREAVDFCRYYGARAVALESENSGLQGKGVYVCISPWNFPLAIFCGQITAALAAGNSVIAKPAEQTPLIASASVELFHQAGVPAGVLQLLLGDGARIGSALLSDARVKGVAFTGSTITAQRINRQLAARGGEGAAFIAETGGQNCMIVDSTALPEQVIDDVISSAFHSAGQRCSALRVLYLQDVIADKTIKMLEGALAHVNVGKPQELATDIGPVIDLKARAGLQQHVDEISKKSIQNFWARLSPELIEQGNYFAPQIFEIDSIKALTQEVFGPVLHIIRYAAKDLDKVIADINATGFGLTLGVHSRIEAMADYVYRKTNVGNTYINRNVIGAVVGVNPFGGHGLSGTGPKAGGPSYLYRFLKPQPNLKLATLSVEQLKLIVDEMMSRRLEMPGPTGESNHLQLVPRGQVAILLDENDDPVALRLITLLAVQAGNSVVLVPITEAANTLSQTLQDELSLYRSTVEQVLANPSIEVVLSSADNEQKDQIRKALADRDGAIVPLVEVANEFRSKHQILAILSYLVSEKTKTDNLVARGGNTQLFNLDE